MTHEDIGRLWSQHREVYTFAKAIAQLEREECAALCDKECAQLGQTREALVAGICAAVIRAKPTP